MALMPARGNDKSVMACKMKIISIALRAIILLLAATGCWYVGQGIYIKAKAVLAQYLLEQAWADTLAGQPAVKPWPWADTWPVARLSVPHLGISYIVLAGAEGNSMAFGPGHLSTAVMPGNPGNSVISAHRDTHFRFLEKLRIGDEVFMQRADGQSYVFRVNATQIVDSRTTRLILDTEVPRLTLLTCYPFDALTSGGPLRYLVFLTSSTTSFRIVRISIAFKGGPVHIVI